MKRRLAFFSLVVLGLAASGYAQNETTASPEQMAWFEVGGRTHLALVHFPIALIMAAFLLEIFAMLRSRAVSPAGLACLNLGWIGGLFTLASGWYLARLTNGDIEVENPLTWLADVPEEEEDRDLFIHAWTGLGATGLGLILAFFGAAARRRDRASAIYRIGLLVATLLVAWAGHMGGELVHGDGFLTEPLEALKEQEAESQDDDDAIETSIADDEVLDLIGDDDAILPEAGESESEVVPDEGAADEGTEGAGDETGALEVEKGDPDAPVRLVSFRRDIAPIFARNCEKCHGAKRGKGGLRLHERAAIFPDDPEEWTVIPGKPDESLLLERMLLDPSSRKFMPKKGDPLPAAELALVKRWIEEGALDDAAEEGDADSSSGETGRAEEPNLDLEAKRARLARVAELVDGLRARGAAANALARGDERLDLNFSVLRDRFTAADLEAVAGFEANVVELNLASTPFDDAMAGRLGDFVNLERLHLERTAVSDEALESLRGLTKLRYLNLYGTAVSDAGLGSLEGLTGLEKLFLWDSRVTAEGAAGLAGKLPALKIDRGESFLPDPVESPKSGDDTLPSDG